MLKFSLQFLLSRKAKSQNVDVLFFSSSQGRRIWRGGVAFGSTRSCGVSWMHMWVAENIFDAETPQPKEFQVSSWWNFLWRFKVLDIFNLCSEPAVIWHQIILRKTFTPMKRTVTSPGQKAHHEVSIPGCSGGAGWAVCVGACSNDGGVPNSPAWHHSSVTSTDEECPHKPRRYSRTQVTEHTFTRKNVTKISTKNVLGFYDSCFLRVEQEWPMNETQDLLQQKSLNMSGV